MPARLHVVELLAVAIDVGRLGWRRASARCCSSGGLYTAWWGHELSGAVFRLLLGLHASELGRAFLRNAGLPAGIGGGGMAAGMWRVLLLFFTSGAPPLLFLWGKPVRLR